MDKVMYNLHKANFPLSIMTNPKARDIYRQSSSSQQRGSGIQVGVKHVGASRKHVGAKGQKKRLVEQSAQRCHTVNAGIHGTRHLDYFLK